MMLVLYTVHVVVCIFLILVVLLQQGKGADLSVFGGGSTQAAFGARGAATLLHKLTVASFVIFTLTTLSIAIFKTSGDGGSVMSDVATEQPAATEQATPAATPDSAAGAEATTTGAEATADEGGQESMAPAPSAEESAAPPAEDPGSDPPPAN